MWLERFINRIHFNIYWKLDGSYQSKIHTWPDMFDARGWNWRVIGSLQMHSPGISRAPSQGEQLSPAPRNREANAFGACKLEAWTKLWGTGMRSPGISWAPSQGEQLSPAPRNRESNAFGACKLEGWTKLWGPANVRGLWGTKLEGGKTWMKSHMSNHTWIKSMISC